MHGKCTNPICPYDHDVLKSVHNKKIINTRGLTFLSEGILLELARTSADPSRSVREREKHGEICCMEIVYLVLGLYRSWKERWMCKEISM